MNLNVDLKALSEIYDTIPTFVSAYLKLLDVSDRNYDPTSFMNARKREILSALASKPQLRDAFVKTMERVEAYLSTNTESLVRGGHPGIAIFASDPKDFFETYPLPVQVENALILDSSPYIRHLAKFVEEYEDFGIILMDQNHADIYLVEGGRITGKEQLREEIFHQHKKGGWSQMRFQRKRDGELVRFYKDIAEQATRIFDGTRINRLIVAGQGDAKKNFLPYLPKTYQDRVIAVLDIETGTPDEVVLREVFPVFFMQERRDEEALVEEFMDAVMKGQGAVYGLMSVLEATKNGRSQIILLNSGKKEVGYKCEVCNVVELTPEICELCGGATNRVDAIEELVELTFQSGADVEFIPDNERLETLGGVGALLRW